MRRRRNPRAVLPVGAALLVRVSGRGTWEDTARLGEPFKHPIDAIDIILVTKAGEILAYLRALTRPPPYPFESTAVYAVVASAALPGYGPALYDTAARLGKMLGFGVLGYEMLDDGTPNQSESARRLWAKNGPRGHWRTPSTAHFKARYGTTVETLLARGDRVGGSINIWADKAYHFYAKRSRE